jgi:hypothetical protein
MWVGSDGQEPRKASASGSSAVPGPAFAPLRLMRVDPGPGPAVLPDPPFGPVRPPDGSDAEIQPGVRPPS